MTEEKSKFHDREQRAERKAVNMQFALLSALGAFLVVDGHLNDSYLDIGGLFPYYSFHTPSFTFISGYFYRPGSEERIGEYARKKILRLLGPYMAYNLIYGIVAQSLHGVGFSFGDSLSSRSLSLEPFMTGHQLEYNLAAWFVPALFLVEMVNVLLRRGVKGLRMSETMWNEYGITVLYFLIGAGGISITISGWFQQGWLTLVRMMFLLPCYRWGVLYRQRLEEKDRAGGLLYMGVLIAIQFILVLSDWSLTYSVAFCNGFTGLLLPYVTAATGIAPWLRVSYIGAEVVKDSAALRYFGGHTYAVMMHHVMALMVLKTLFVAFAKYTSLFMGFSFEQYKTDLWHCYFPKDLPQLRVLYLIWAIALLLVFQCLLDRVKGVYRKGRTSSSWVPPAWEDSCGGVPDYSPCPGVSHSRS